MWAVLSEPVGVGGVGVAEGLLALWADLRGGAVVHRCRGVQADAGVAVLVVVVGEELLAERARVCGGSEPVGEGGGSTSGS